MRLFLDYLPSGFVADLFKQNLDLKFSPYLPFFLPLNNSEPPCKRAEAVFFNYLFGVGNYSGERGAVISDASDIHFNLALRVASGRVAGVQRAGMLKPANFLAKKVSDAAALRAI